MTSIALYTLTGNYLALMDTLADGDFDAQTIADTIEASGIVDDIAAKATGLEMVARSMEAHGPAIKAEIDRLSALMQRRQKAATALRAYLLSNMQAAQITKLESPLFSIKVQNNPPAVDIFEPALLPAKFMKQAEPPPPAADKTAIKAALKAGEDVPGARLTTGQRLAIS